MMSNSELKKKFRASSEWKKFRQELLEQQKIDPVTLSKLSKHADCHHLLLSNDIDDYKILDSEHQVMLNTKTHECVHFLYNYFIKDEAVIERLKSILSKMKQLNNKGD